MQFIKIKIYILNGHTNQINVYRTGCIRRCFQDRL